MRRMKLGRAEAVGSLWRVVFAATLLGSCGGPTAAAADLPTAPGERLVAAVDAFMKCDKKAADEPIVQSSLVELKSRPVTFERSPGSTEVVVTPVRPWLWVFTGGQIVLQVLADGVVVGQWYQPIPCAAVHVTPCRNVNMRNARVDVSAVKKVTFRVIDVEDAPVLRWQATYDAVDVLKQATNRELGRVDASPELVEELRRWLSASRVEIQWRPRDDGSRASDDEYVWVYPEGPLSEKWRAEVSSGVRLTLEGIAGERELLLRPLGKDWVSGGTRDYFVESGASCRGVTIARSKIRPVDDPKSVLIRVLAVPSLIDPGAASWYGNIDLTVTVPVTRLSETRWGSTPPVRLGTE